MNRMPKQRRTIFELFQQEGLSHDEIAGQLGISKETVYNQLSLARKELREIILVFVLLFWSCPLKNTELIDFISSVFG